MVLVLLHLPTIPWWVAFQKGAPSHLLVLTVYDLVLSLIAFLAGFRVTYVSLLQN
jgi:hypothetical protein